MAGPLALAVQGRINATPSIASLDHFVVVTWGATDSGTTDVFSAVSRDGGQTFGALVRVNDVPADAKVNGEQPPHVALAARSGRDPLITVVWTSKRPTGTMLLRSQSQDGGRSFVPATIVPGTDAPGNRGWESITIDRAGRISAAWLDHREVVPRAAMPAMSSSMDHTAHEGRRDRAARDYSWRVLLLQDGHRRRPGWRGLHRLASRVSRRSARHHRRGGVP